MSDDYRHYHSSLTTGGPLPLTPLIDMVFLIVIFFMINAAFAMHSVIPVELPRRHNRRRPRSDRVDHHGGGGWPDLPRP